MAIGIFEFFCSSFAILLFLYYYFTNNFGYWKTCGINGPKPIPIFGNIVDHFFGKISMGDFFKKIYDSYPEEPMVGVFLANNPALVLRHPEYIKKVLIKDFSSFSDRHITDHEKGEALSVHLFRITSSRWRPLRMRLSPVFTSGKLKEMYHLLLKCSDHFERYLNEQVPKEEIVECRELTAKFLIDVIGVCAFGIETNALSSKDNEFYKMGRQIFTFNLKTILRIRFREYLPWLYDHYGHIVDQHEVTNFMTNVLMETIKHRKQNNVRRNDFVDVLIDLKDHPEKLGLDKVSDTYITAQAFVFFAAGFETSSSTASNALYELAQNKSIQEKVREEIMTTINSNGGVVSYNSIKEMNYLGKIFQETLRKYPPVSFLGRTAINNYTFEGTNTTVLKGQQVYVPIYAIQRDPNIYPNPDVFDPERFSDENIQLRDPMFYLPFGDGPRNCIGARFAVYQTKITLIKILSNYKVDVCEKTQIPFISDPKQTMMLFPKHGIYLKLTKLDK